MGPTGLSSTFWGWDDLGRVLICSNVEEGYLSLLVAGSRGVGVVPRPPHG